ncbi:uncharacterized protein [Littorina saxatilis]|uniref:Uncharacterized protein n=1 Tax=Littorina saxatilis TaxID=31220 RepID=A0AAN9AS22_9CAEN
MVGALAIVCLMVVSSAVGIDPPSPGYKPKALTFEELTALVDGLEGDLNADLGIISDVTTLLAIADEYQDVISGRRVPKLNLINNQQDDLIDLARSQIKALQHRADEIPAAVAQVLVEVNFTTDSFATLRTRIEELVRDVNQRQGGAIDILEDRVVEWEQGILDQLDNAIASLNIFADAASDRVDVAQSFVDSRICQYGDAVIDDPYGEGYVHFKKPFDDVPVVALTTIGFRGQLDKKSYGKYDILATDKRVVEVNTDGFRVTAKDHSDGMVEVDRLYCQYMACQNLDKKVTLDPLPPFPEAPTPWLG